MMVVTRLKKHVIEVWLDVSRISPPTIPGILQAVSVLSRFLNCASEMHMKVVKRVTMYVKVNLDYGVRFGKSQILKFQGYPDSDWVGSDDRHEKHLRLLF